MAGSYGHCVTRKGRLRKRTDLLGMLDTSSGDVYEAIEEMYGMIWFVASLHPGDAAVIVELARANYKNGLAVSPLGLR